MLDEPALADRLTGLGRRLSERYSLSAMVDAYRDLILDDMPQRSLADRAASEFAPRSGKP